MHQGRTTGARSRRGRDRDDALVVYGVNAVTELLASGAPVTRLHLGPGLRTAELQAAARHRGVAVTSADRAILERISGTPHHQGAVAETGPFRYEAFERLIGEGRASILALDGVQDPRNLGAILRTARAVGVGGVILPRDRSAGITSVVAAASAGLVFGLRIARVANLSRSLDALKKAGFWLVGLVPRGGTPIDRFDPPPRPVLVVGGDGEGLRPLVLRGCDFTVTVPMRPGVESLNVSVAAAIALYEMLLRRRDP